MKKNLFNADATRERRKAMVIHGIIGGLVLAVILGLCVTVWLCSVGSPAERLAMFISRLDQG